MECQESSLTPQEVVAVQTLAERGTPPAQIAQLLGVDEKAVKLVLPDPTSAASPSSPNPSVVKEMVAKAVERQQSLYQQRWKSLRQASINSENAQNAASQPALARSDSSFARQLQREENQAEDTVTMTRSDSEYARQLQQEENRAEDNVPMTRGDSDFAKKLQQEENQIPGVELTRSDSAFAHKLQQQEQDASFLQQLQRQENQPGLARGDSELARELQRQDENQHKPQQQHAAVSQPLLGTPGAQRNDALATMSYTDVLPDGSNKPAHVDVVVYDARPGLKAGQIKFGLQGFTLAHWPTKLTTRQFYNPDTVKRIYYKEQEELIKQQTGATQVVILNDIVRNAGKADKRGNDNPFAGGGNGVNGYANVVHTDFRARRAVTKFYEQPDHKEMIRERGDGPKGKYMMINTWRNISEDRPIWNNTLACCDHQTVDSPGDYVSCDVPISPEAHAEQYRLKTETAPKHHWYYFPHMMKDEVLMFIQFDSDTNADARFCFHTAFSDPTVDPELPARESVETRAILFFPPPPDVIMSGRKLIDVIREVHAGNVVDLCKQMAEAAAHGILQPGELEDLTDKASYQGAQNEDFIMQLCIERGIPYEPHQWQPGHRAEQMLEELKALKTFERTRFLEGPKDEVVTLQLDSEEAKQDINNLQLMFPDLDRDRVVAVYTGFGGNFETAVEMLSLALAEQYSRVNHGRDHNH
eukprot:gnl/MRDRNA2_/MRDRNA2_77418_c0_seq1.p1 gnl/MRDRNA2_/MRDRNA2_77418_c0~~gnl/MRDRNA2_/MRDRNA2_77418_c0_seq1.p1  ORF type:complete len:730 (+),score=139.21 gnl/MRDRNA2_/MRDRNA2_77418_c0_seq1:92-2191(+)